MELVVYQRMNEVEQEHWWFRARQEIILSLLQQWGRLESGMRVLDLGCGTGNLLEALLRFDVRAEGRDMSGESLRICNSRGLKVEHGSLPHSINVVEKADTVIMLDVLEHIPRDYDTLQKLHDLTHDTSRVLLTVPAHPFLWSHHDEVHHHERRYSKRNLLNLIEETKWEVEFFSSYNALLFPLAALFRLMKRVTGKEVDENKIPHPFVNRTLWNLFRSEKGLLKQQISLPFGLSYIAYLKPRRSVKTERR